MTNVLLPIALECAVSMKIIELQQMYSHAEIMLMLEIHQEDWTDAIAGQGDVIQFHEPKLTALAFNKLVLAVACMAFVSGGVEVFGTRYKADKISCQRKEI
jgi:hypothetical protein